MSYTSISKVKNNEFMKVIWFCLSMTMWRGHTRFFKWGNLVDSGHDVDDWLMHRFMHETCKIKHFTFKTYAIKSPISLLTSFNCLSVYLSLFLLYAEEDLPKINNIPDITILSEVEKVWPVIHPVRIPPLWSTACSFCWWTEERLVFRSQQLSLQEFAKF